MPGRDFLGDAWQEALLDVTSLGFLYVIARGPGQSTFFCFLHVEKHRKDVIIKKFCRCDVLPNIWTFCTTYLSSAPGLCDSVCRSFKKFGDVFFGMPTGIVGLGLIDWLI
jgi:hypothetical protein